MTSIRERERERECNLVSNLMFDAQSTRNGYIRARKNVDLNHLDTAGENLVKRGRGGVGGGGDYALHVYRISYLG